MAEPRIPPIPPDERTEEQRELLGSVGLDTEANIFTTLVRHPKLFRRWLGFSGRLLMRSGLTPRDRELVILRVAWRCQAEYEWGQHVPIARQAGLDDEEIRRVAAGPEAEGWTDDERTLLRAVDELHDDHRIGDTTWSALAARYGTEELIELPMLAGHYALLAGTLNSLGVPLDAGLPPLGETDGATT